MKDTHERLYEAEVHRLKGECLLGGRAESPSDQVEGAEACFLRSLRVAQAQNAKLLQLRACVSLARLLRCVPKGIEVRRWLAELHDRFDEGQETADLRDAGDLLRGES